MIDSDIESLVEDIEAEELLVDEKEQEYDEAREREANIEQAIATLSNDEAIVRQLHENELLASEERQAASEELERARERVDQLKSQIDEANDQIQSEMAVLLEIEQLGEDVSEGKSILEKRAEVLAGFQQRLEVLAEKLGMSINALGHQEINDTIGTQENSSDRLNEQKVEDQENAFRDTVSYMHEQNYEKEGFENQSKNTQSKGIIQKFFYKIVGGNDSSDASKNNLFGSFETDRHINGSDVFVKGDNYERFKEDYYSQKESVYEAYDIPKEIDIPPSMIEGIHLGEREMEDPAVFWGQHERGGSLESFKEIAKHIPEVRNQLSSGKRIDEILDDPVLSKCASIYFVNKPRVIDSNGYYEFESNGRHRILAAREVGYDIPVAVVGRRNRNF